MAKVVIAFDLFGTILSTESIAKEIAEIYGNDDAKTIAQLARRYQLEYTWRMNSMGHYHPFDQVTRQSFRHAVMEVIGKPLLTTDEDRIMNAYNGLDSFPDVPEALNLLQGNTNLDPWIFSNGTPSMISGPLRTSQGISEMASRIFPPEKVVSVDTHDLRVYKPDPRTYQYMTKTAGRDNSLGDVWLVSSNPFDALGAVAAGMKAAWIDRGGGGWIDGLGGVLGMKPTLVAKGVDQAIRGILEEAER